MSGEDLADAPRIRVRRVDVRILHREGEDEVFLGAERITKAVVAWTDGQRRFGRLRPLFCPECRRHFTSMVPNLHPVAPTVVHYRCAECGGDGTPVSLEVPR